MWPRPDIRHGGIRPPSANRGTGQRSRADTGRTEKRRAATGTRTLDLRFTKASLYQLSYGGRCQTDTAAVRMESTQNDPRAVCIGSWEDPTNRSQSLTILPIHASLPACTPKARLFAGETHKTRCQPAIEHDVGSLPTVGRSRRRTDKQRSPAGLAVPRDFAGEQPGGWLSATARDRSVFREQQLPQVPAQKKALSPQFQQVRHDGSRPHQVAPVQKKTLLLQPAQALHRINQEEQCWLDYRMGNTILATTVVLPDVTRST